MHLHFGRDSRGGELVPREGVQRRINEQIVEVHLPPNREDVVQRMARLQKVLSEGRGALELQVLKIMYLPIVALLCSTIVHASPVCGNSRFSIPFYVHHKIAQKKRANSAAMRVSRRRQTFLQ